MAGFAVSWRGRTTINGKRSEEKIDFTADDILAVSRSLAAAIPCQLTTRADNDIGTLTLETGHGITEDDTVGFAWLVAGVWTYTLDTIVTAADGTTLDIDSGSHSLPVNLTNGFVMVKQSEQMTVTSFAAILAMQFKGTKEHIAVLNMDTPAEDDPRSLAFVITPESPLSYVSGQQRNAFQLPAATFGDLADHILYTVDFYNLEAAANAVDGMIAHN